MRKAKGRSGETSRQEEEARFNRLFWGSTGYPRRPAPVRRRGTPRNPEMFFSGLTDLSALYILGPKALAGMEEFHEVAR